MDLWVSECLFLHCQIYFCTWNLKSFFVLFTYVECLTSYCNGRVVCWLVRLFALMSCDFCCGLFSKYTGMAPQSSCCDCQKPEQKVLDIVEVDAQLLLGQMDSDWLLWTQTHSFAFIYCPHGWRKWWPCPIRTKWHVLLIGCLSLGLTNSLLPHSPTRAWSISFLSYGIRAYTGL